METTLFLSQELLIEILLRLPVKSLIRFKCVSKTWLSLISNLISDPKFARLHFELTVTHAQRLALLKPDASEIQSIDFNAPLHDTSATTMIKLNFNFPPLQPYERVRVLGSCRGFIVMLLDHFPNLYLCNPTTGFHKQLPSPVYFPPDLDHEPFLFLCGFGYDSATDDYLVTLSPYDPFNDYILNHMELFSLKANAWKLWEGPPLPYTICSEYYDGVFFNGTIHWIARHIEREVDLIVAFDLIEMSFSEIALPMPHDFDGKLYYYGLRVFGGFLGVCTTPYVSYNCIIWVMEKYKVESSWTRFPIMLSPYISPICRTKSGDIVGVDCHDAIGDRDRLVKFNINGEVQEERPYPSHQYILVMYTESLLSLPYDN